MSRSASDGRWRSRLPPAGTGTPGNGPGRRALFGAAVAAAGTLGLSGGGMRGPVSAQPAPRSADVAAACGAAAPAAPGDGWPTAAPQEVGLDAGRLCAMATRLEAAPQDRVHAVLVARRGRLAFERYFAGEDQRLGAPLGRVAFGPHTLHDLRHANAVVVALLVGLAIAGGSLEGIDEPVLRFFPEHADLHTPERARIRLRHLLTMTAGLAWDEEGTPYADARNDERRMREAPDPYRHALDRPVVYPPGERFILNSGAPALLGAVVQRAVGMPLDRFAREALFAPLGITAFEWAAFPAHPDPMPHAGLRLRPRDLTKLGQLLLSGGAWAGRQVVPAAWVRAMRSLHVETVFPGASYGYLLSLGSTWGGREIRWADTTGAGGRDVRWEAATGDGGQLLVLVPELEMVAVVMAGLYGNRPLSAFVPAGILDRDVIPAAR